MYYSRLPISEYQQLGLYAFSRDMLSLFSNLEVCEQEIENNVEMLRYIENGYHVKMVEVDDHAVRRHTF